MLLHVGAQRCHVGGTCRTLMLLLHVGARRCHFGGISRTLVFEPLIFDGWSRVYLRVVDNLFRVGLGIA